MLDVAVVGGSAAGLSAALYLGRMRRQVVVFDTGKPCNRFSHASHGHFTRDGIAPAELLQIGRDQLQPYPTVHLRAEQVTSILPQAQGFLVETAAGNSFPVRKVLLATGMRDNLPPLANIEQFWGSSVFHCPYCDGWEVRDQPIAIYNNGDFALHIAKLLRNLTADLVICTGETATFTDAERQQLSAHNIPVIETPIVGLEGTGNQLTSIVFADDTSLVRHALFVMPKLTQHTDLAARLGCALTDAGFVQVNESMQTTVAGVYAAGDMTSMARAVVFAAMQGALAATRLHMELSTEDFQQ